MLDISDDAEFLTQGVSEERVQEIMKQAMANNRGKVKDAETLQSYICQDPLFETARKASNPRSETEVYTPKSRDLCVSKRPDRRNSVSPRRARCRSG